MTPRDLLLALAVMGVWGVNFIAIKWGVAEIPPLLMTALRYVATVLPAILFVRRPRVALGVLVAYGLCIGVGQFGFLFTAIHLGMPAGLASLVLQLQSFFTIGLAVAFLGERPRRTQLAGAAVALGGIGLIAFGKLGGAALWPLAMTVAAALGWAVSNIIVKRAGGIDMLGFVVWSGLVPILPLLGLSLGLEGPGAVPYALAHVSWVGIGAVLFVGWASTVFGYGAWSALLGRYEASLVAPFTLLVPVVGLASGQVILGETMGGLDWAGSALVFIGLFVNVLGPRVSGRLSRGG